MNVTEETDEMMKPKKKNIFTEGMRDITRIQVLVIHDYLSIIIVVRCSTSHGVITRIQVLAPLYYN